MAAQIGLTLCRDTLELTLSGEGLPTVAAGATSGVDFHGQPGEPTEVAAGPFHYIRGGGVTLRLI